MVTPREHRETIEELMKSFSNEYYIYGPKLFDQRLHEEKLRADVMNTAFTYLEIAFDELFVPDLDHADLKSLWRAIMRGMTMLLRGSDVKGFLHEDRGLGILFLDSLNAPAERLLGNLRRYLAEERLEDRLNPRLLEHGFPYVVYKGKRMPVDGEAKA